MKDTIQKFQEYVATYVYKDYPRDTYILDMLYGIGISLGKEYEFAQGFDKFKDELTKLIHPKIGVGYVAIPEEGTQYAFGRSSKPEGEYPIITWWITPKTFWDKYGYIDDSHLYLNIPDFAQDRESCFVYQPEWPCADLEKQSKLLSDLGFEILPLGIL